jgi:hypothetical protein
MNKVFDWCEEANPTQPLTTPLWKDRPWSSHLNELQSIQVQRSDIISFHAYGDLNDLKSAVSDLGGYGEWNRYISIHYYISLNLSLPLIHLLWTKNVILGLLLLLLLLLLCFVSR